MTLLRMQDNTSSGKTLICELCDSGDLSVSRCIICSVFMCEFCVTAHKRINTFKGHQILSLEEVKAVGSQALVKPAFCEKHTGETLKLFCKTCQKTICRDCTIVDHREHKYDFIADVAEKERNAVRAVLQETKAKERAFAEGLKAVQMMKSRVQRKVSEVNKEVDSFFNEQIKALEYYRTNLKNEAMTQGQVRVKQLESQTEMLSLLLAQLKSSIEFTDRAISDGDDVKLLSMKKQLIQRLAQLNSSKYHLRPCKDDYLKLQVHQAIWDIGKMASLSYIPVSPQKCTVSVVGGEEGVMYQTITGQSVDFVLITKDENGKKVTGGGHQVRAEVVFNSKSPEKKQKGLHDILPVQDNGDGSYNFSYRRADVGFVTLTVEVEGKSALGSPFTWQVKYPEIILGDRNSERETKGLMKVQLGGWGMYAKQNASALTEGMYSWKLQLVSSRPPDRIGIEIGVRSGYDAYEGREGKWKEIVKWCWCYNSANQSSNRSDRQPPSITSVQHYDVFTVFLNLNTRKLIIYNIRSKQTELFTEVKGEVFPVISPSDKDFCKSGTACLTLDVESKQ